MTLQHSVTRAVTGAKAALTRARSTAWALRGSPNGGRGSGLRILLYHRVSDEDDVLAVKPRAFRDQMAYLAEHGYDGRDLERARNTVLQGRNVVGLTFDDGFRDVAEHALPVLREHGFSATVFVCPAVVDGRARFAWYRGAQPPVLTWDEIVDLDREGTLRFEAHTLTHPDLRALSEEEARAEIEGSRRELAERLARPVTSFCYPAGLLTERERRIVAEAGFAAAVTCEPGSNDPATDQLLLRRVQVERSDTLLDFRAKLAGAHDAPLPGRAAYRRLRYRDSSRS